MHAGIGSPAHAPPGQQASVGRSVPAAPSQAGSGASKGNTARTALPASVRRGTPVNAATTSWRAGSRFRPARKSR